MPLKTEQGKEGFSIMTNHIISGKDLEIKELKSLIHTLFWFMSLQQQKDVVCIMASKKSDLLASILV